MFQTVEETCVSFNYDESRTLCEKKVTAQAELFGFKTTLETFAIQRYKKNQELASLGLEFILHKLYLPQLPPPPITGIKTPDTRTFSRKLSDKAKNLLKSSSSDTIQSVFSSFCVHITCINPACYCYTFFYLQILNFTQAPNDNKLTLRPVLPK